jgi:hypothetical protein
MQILVHNYNILNLSPLALNSKIDSHLVPITVFFYAGTRDMNDHFFHEPRSLTIMIVIMEKYEPRSLILNPQKNEPRSLMSDWRSFPITINKKILSLKLHF